MTDVLVSCGSCQWSQTRPTQAAADKALTAHQQRRHDITPLAGVQQLDGVSWREQAFSAVDVLNARGEDWTFYDLHAMVGDPPNAKTALGTFAADLHRLGRAHPVGWQQSDRPKTAKSGVRKWSGNAARCMDCKAGVAAS